MPGLRHTFILQVKDDGGRVVAGETHIETGDANEAFNVSVAPLGNTVVPLTVDVSTLLSFYVVSDKDVTLTVNDDGTPDLTVPLAAGIPYWWHVGAPGSNPLSIDITSIKLTNAGPVAAVVQGAFLTNT